MGLAQMFRSLDEGLARAAADRNARDDAEAARVRAIIADSLLVRFVERLFAAPALAWRHSTTRALVTDAAAAFFALALPQRIRLLGWMLVVAVITRGVIYVLAGNVAGRWTLALWGLLVFVGAFMMAASGSVAAAWIDWRRRHR